MPRRIILRRQEFFLFFRFHRAGYCNSTAPVEANCKPRAKLLSYILLPLPHRPLSSFPVYGGPRSLITQCYALRNVWFSPDGVVFGRRRLFLSLTRIKKERRVATLRPHSIMPLSVVPLCASSSPRIYIFFTLSSSSPHFGIMILVR